MKTTNLDFDQLNQLHWDELALVHKRSYRLKDLYNKESLLNNVERKELGNIKNKNILHLQCHIGKESVSLALEGAKVTAVDYSIESIKVAKNLAAEVGVNIEFIHSNVYDLENFLETKFDIVYTSKGVVQWLSDLNEWAEIINEYLVKGGFFYIQEIHPLKYLIEYSDDNRVMLTNYDINKPIKKHSFDYSDITYFPKNPAYEYRWSLGEIITSISKVGLQIEFVNEINKLFYNDHWAMVKDDKDWWSFPNQRNLPLTFSIKAWKK